MIPIHYGNRIINLNIPQDNLVFDLKAAALVLLDTYEKICSEGDWYVWRAKIMGIF